jgi:rhamnulokinase
MPSNDDVPRCFVAVDLGGQSGRVLLGDFADGRLAVAEAHRFANVPVERDGLLCWDAERLFDETITGIRAAVALARSRGRAVAGIGVDSWGVDYGLVDEGGQLVAPVRHHRAGEQRHVDAGARAVPTAEAYRRTGITELAINTCFQLLRDAELGLLDGRPTALLTADLWTFWLTGARGAERTLASTTGMVDWTSGGWALDLLDRWGIPRQTVPELVPAGSCAGLTTAEVTARIQATAPIPVFRVAAHDTASAFAAVTAPGDRAAVISCGTWALVGCSTRAPVLTPEAMAAGFTNEEGVDHSVVLVRNLSGTWLLEECLREWAEPDASVVGLRTALLTEAAELPDDALGTVIDPGAPELIERGAMPDRLASLYRRAGGDARRLTRAETVRLVLESLAASFATTIRAASGLTGTDVREVHMIGGGSRIELLVALTERATGLPVRVGHAEATSVGSMCVQSVAAGAFGTLAEARAAAGLVRDPSGTDEGGSRHE